MAKNKTQKASSWTPQIQKKAPSLAPPPIVVQRDPVSPETEVPMPDYTPLPADAVENHPLMRKLSAQPIQAKLTIGAPGDKYEQEADQVARKVVSQINSPVARNENGEPGQIQTKPAISILQRLSESNKTISPFAGGVQRQEAIAGGDASQDLESSINRARGGGQPLDGGLQRSMGQAMGADFSGVRVHTDAQSDQLNRSIQAKAFTTGQDIFFGQNQYNPGSPTGQELIAHELTHVVPQNRGAVMRSHDPQQPLPQHPPTEKTSASVGDRTIQGKGEMTENSQESREESRFNQTGLPDALKAGVENLSGYSLDDVRVHYNSPKPAQLQALAYTQGTEIHVAPGQVKHLPHEAWHVVQQMQGRVKPTLQMKGIQINDDRGLEREADVMGDKASGAKVSQLSLATNPQSNCTKIGSQQQSTLDHVSIQKAIVQLLRHTIVQHGEMSGDQFQIATALKLDPELRLILVGETGNNPQDKSESIYDFYVSQTGIEPNRIKFIRDAQDMKKEVQRILNAQNEDFFEQETASVGQATNVVKDVFSGSDRTQEMRNAWISNSGYSETDFGKIVRDFQISFDMPTVVLWSRQSGALGGLHPEHDSSYKGLEQLMEYFTDLNYAVIIVGDDPKGKITGYGGSIRFQKAIRLGQFWERRGLWQKPRTAQFAFFEFLRQRVPKLVHIGMRSGNLEAYAYMGHRVIFLEEEGRQDSKRMDKLVGAEIKLSYGTVKLSELPTITARFMGKFRGEINTLHSEYKKLQKTNRAADRLRARLGEKRVKTVYAFKALEISIESLPPYQKSLKFYQFLKNNVESVRDLIGKEREERPGFTEDDLVKIILAELKNKPDEELEKMPDFDDIDFGNYEEDRFVNDPNVMFWRNLDTIIQNTRGDYEQLVIILTKLTPDLRNQLKERYQEDINLMLGYRGRVTPRIQRLVIRIIDDLRGGDIDFPKCSYSRFDDSHDRGGSGASGFDNMPHWVY